MTAKAIPWELVVQAVASLDDVAIENALKLSQYRDGNFMVGPKVRPRRLADTTAFLSTDPTSYKERAPETTAGSSIKESALLDDEWVVNLELGVG